MEPTNQPQTTQPSPQIVYVKKRSGNIGRKISCLFIIFLLLICCFSIMLSSIWANLPADKYNNLTVDILKLQNSGLSKDICSNLSSTTVIYRSLACDKLIDTTYTSQSSTSSYTSSVPVINTTLDEKFLINLIDRVSESVVTIAADSELNPNLVSQNSGSTVQNIGSGFIVRSDGLIVTNSHVVSDTSYDYSVILPSNNTPLKITKIIQDPNLDIAILQVDAKNLPALTLGDSDSLKRGQTAIAIGSPLGDLTDTVTKGIISGLNRDVEIQSGSYFNSIVKRFQGVIQTDAAINRGNSGGPLINSQGEVIGMNFATTESANNISFALPINRVKDKIAEYEKYGRFIQPYIGVQTSATSLYMIDKQYVDGILIMKVLANSPAETTGLLKGDLILKIDGESVYGKSLVDEIQKKKIGDTLKLQIWRQSQKMDVNVVVADKGE